MPVTHLFDLARVERRLGVARIVALQRRLARELDQPLPLCHQLAPYLADRARRSRKIAQQLRRLLGQHRVRRERRCADAGGRDGGHLELVPGVWRQLVNGVMLVDRIRERGRIEHERVEVALAAHSHEDAIAEHLEARPAQVLRQAPLEEEGRGANLACDGSARRPREAAPLDVVLAERLVVHALAGAGALPAGLARRLGGGHGFGALCCCGGHRVG